MVAFGEGLQLVNILKDAGDDARDGRVYLPPHVPRRPTSSPWPDAISTRRKTTCWRCRRGGAPKGFVAFTGTSLVLANASLDRLEQLGPGAKVPRADVVRLVGGLQHALEVGAQLDLRGRAQA